MSNSAKHAHTHIADSLTENYDCFMANAIQYLVYVNIKWIAPWRAPNVPSEQKPKKQKLMRSQRACTLTICRLIKLLHVLNILSTFLIYQKIRIIRISVMNIDGIRSIG